MDKAKQRKRDIQFYSNKDGAMVLVHTSSARDFAKTLEQDAWVSSYKSCVPLDLQQFSHVQTVDIRADYMKTLWVSDFLIINADGSKRVVELVEQEQLLKRSIIEKLELSRRYWRVMDVQDWKVKVVSI